MRDLRTDEQKFSDEIDALHFEAYMDSQIRIGLRCLNSIRTLNGMKAISWEEFEVGALEADSRRKEETWDL